MRPPACTVAQRVSKQCPHLMDAGAMPKETCPIRRTQVIHHPRASSSQLSGPIAFLPAEVLANVFLYVVAGESAADGGSAALVLAQVCSSWRRVALGIPRLWETLDLSLTIKPTLPSTSPFARPPPSPISSSTTTTTTTTITASTSPSPSKTPQALADKASLWFERARKHLLSVSIKLTASSPNATYDVSSSFTGPILSNAHAIRHLSISLTSSSQLQKFLTSKGAKFTNLESLSLSIERFDACPPTITVFNNSPQLTRVSFDLGGLPPSPSLLRLPWSQLENFDMTGASILPANEFRTLLSTCTNLRQASIWVTDAEDGEVQEPQNAAAADKIARTTTTTSITLPNLTKLSISFYGRDEKTASSLFTTFNLPHLRHFHFFSGFITLPLMPAIAASRQLETLVLSGVNVSADGFLTFASAHPSLRSLTLDLRYFDEDNVSDVLGVLAAGGKSSLPPVLENLVNLSLWTRDISPYSTVLSRMVCARGRYCSSRGEVVRLVLYLARQQHGACCYFSTCGKQSSGGLTRLDAILAVASVCESTKGVELYISDVKPDEGIHEVAQ